jgi:hypothetical protein
MLDASQADAPDYIVFLGQAWYYVLIVPFSLSFGRMVSNHFSGNYLLIAVASILAFGAAKESYWNVESAVRQAIAGASSCWKTLPQQLAGKYQKGEMLRSLDFRVDQSVLRSYSPDSLTVERSPCQGLWTTAMPRRLSGLDGGANPTF